ncbi:MAG: inosine/xanthosine triphosphatase [Nitrososphaerales archaeon]|nr:inosine/xanthosine triphosphatase [Nitrososphaerales archaeon]
MIIAVGTKNPAKLEGIRRAFTQYYDDVKLRPVDSSSVARPQPVGLVQMVEGAIARARFAISNTGDDFGVGVEAGIFMIGDGYFDHQQAAVVDSKGRVSLGHSAGYPLPRGAMESMVKDGKELEQFAEALSGVGQIGDKGGLVHYLTKGKMTRADLTQQCVTTALVPWLHPDVYWP